MARELEPYGRSGEGLVGGVPIPSACAAAVEAGMPATAAPQSIANVVECRATFESQYCVFLTR